MKLFSQRRREYNSRIITEWSRAKWNRVGLGDLLYIAWSEFGSNLRQFINFLSPLLPSTKIRDSWFKRLEEIGLITDFAVNDSQSLVSQTKLNCEFTLSWAWLSKTMSLKRLLFQLPLQFVSIPHTSKREREAQRKHLLIQSSRELALAQMEITST